MYMRVRYSKQRDIIAKKSVKATSRIFGKNTAVVLVSAALLAGCVAKQLPPAESLPWASEKSAEDDTRLFTSAIPSFPEKKKKSSFITIETPVVDAKSDALQICEERNNERLNELSYAIKNGDKQKVKDLLENGVDVDNKIDGEISAICDDTPLTLAISKGRTEIVKLLLEYGADADYRTSEYYDTPLMLAARKGHTEIVKLLLEYGADINESKLLNSGKSALIVAADYGFTDIVKILLENGADPDILDVAHVGYGVRVLFSPDCTHERAINGWSALMYAAWSGDAEMVELLINAGADVNIRAKHSKDETALMVVSEAGHADVVELLIDAGADVDAVGDEHTALVYAVEYGKLDVIKVLVEKGGADVNPKISDCFTLFEFAEDKEIKNLLLEYGARCDCCCHEITKED